MSSHHAKVDMLGALTSWKSCSMAVSKIDFKEGVECNNRYLESCHRYNNDMDITIPLLIISTWTIRLF